MEIGQSLHLSETVNNSCSKRLSAFSMARYQRGFFTSYAGMYTGSYQNKQDADVWRPSVTSMRSGRDDRQVPKFAEPVTVTHVCKVVKTAFNATQLTGSKVTDPGTRAAPTSSSPNEDCYSFLTWALGARALRHSPQAAALCLRSSSPRSLNCPNSVCTSAARSLTP